MPSPHRRPFAKAPAPTGPFVVHSYRAIRAEPSIWHDGRPFISELPNEELAEGLADLLNAAALLADGAAFRDHVPNRQMIAGAIAKAMGGSIDFESFRAPRHG